MDTIISQPQLNVAENATTIFITLNKAANAELAANALRVLRSLYQEHSRRYIEFVSEEEQRELDAILAARSDEDKEIAFVEYDTVEL